MLVEAESENMVCLIETKKDGEREAKKDGERECETHGERECETHAERECETHAHARTRTCTYATCREGGCGGGRERRAHGSTSSFVLECENMVNDTGGSEL